MSEELIIQLVRAHPCLYNTEDENYRNMKLKEELWSNIASNLGKSVASTKDMWKKLRNCHRDALRRRKHNLEENKAVKKWKHEDTMAFLLKYMSGTMDNAKSLASSDIEEGEEEDADDMDSQITEEYTYLSSPGPSSAGKSKNNSQYSYIDCYQDVVVEKKDMKHAVEKDELDYFFESMCMTTKNLPKKYQLKIKRRLFEAVSEAEEESSNEFDSPMTI